MDEIITLTAELRSDTGTTPAKSLRREGKIPSVIYKKGIEPVHIAAFEKEVTKLYRKAFFSSTLIQLQVNNKKFKVLPKAVQLHPLTELVRHADFILIEPKDEKVKVNVPIIFEGKDKSIALKRGGFLNIIRRKIELLCLVKNIPQYLTIDVSNMKVGTSIRLSQIQLPQDCSIVKSTDFVIASIIGKGGKQEEDKGEEENENT